MIIGSGGLREDGGAFCERADEEISMTVAEPAIGIEAYYMVMCSVDGLGGRGAVGDATSART